KITGLARGSAFIKFESREAALQCVEAAEILNASSTNPLIVHGRKCRADLAVDRNEAKRLREEEHSAGKDKRNLYLANEGLLVDSSVSFKRHGDE
ncbi:RBM28, partial [Symbiodinium microadriaticum]